MCSLLHNKSALENIFCDLKKRKALMVVVVII